MKTSLINRKNKPIFNHFKGLKCEHYHVSETKDKKSVDCPACLRILKINKINNNENSNARTY